MGILPASGSFVLYDTEFTSWPGFLEQGFKAPGRYPEVIQIGGIRVDAGNGLTEVEAFEIKVVPSVNPDLSDYIVALTGITQACLDAEGVPFAAALARFVEFLDETEPLFSFGSDGAILRKNCDLNDVAWPPLFAREVNLKARMADAGLVPRDASSSDIPACFGLPRERQSHDALADVRGLVRVLRYLRDEGRLD